MAIESPSQLATLEAVWQALVATADFHGPEHRSR